MADSAAQPPAGAPMTVTLNGDPHELPGPMTVAALVVHLGLEGKPVAVERNRELVTKARFSEVSVEPGDELEIVTFFGGG